MTNKIYQLKIALKGSKPSIWRRILVSPDLLLSDFHKIIQSTMGWTNSHLHQFVSGNSFYTVRSPGDDFWDDMDNVDYEKEKIKISHFLKNEKERFIYEYDFGDSWTHSIVLEKILPIDKKKKYPICVTGKMSCPPEDCGGIWGYMDMVDILKQPKHEEYEDYVEWLGDDFDPKFFDKKEVNELLQSKDYGCITMRFF